MEVENLCKSEKPMSIKVYGNINVESVGGDAFISGSNVAVRAKKDLVLAGSNVKIQAGEEVVFARLMQDLSTQMLDLLITKLVVGLFLLLRESIRSDRFWTLEPHSILHLQVMLR